MVASIAGLDGTDTLDEASTIDGDLRDPAVADAYRQYSERRIQSSLVQSVEGPVCDTCNRVPCICGQRLEVR